ncbi:uncharacterized protein LOC135394041 [Ornithodoros turicata]|uniref:uncharacterized protein LOC135394041 n=1 Tax=Ornithodoros turicata TaxID=34597 RepID=UPI003138EA36
MCIENTAEWVSSLPVALLGPACRTQLFRNCSGCAGELFAFVNCSPAELVYGTTLRLPSEFHASQTTLSPGDSAAYLVKLQQAFRCLRPSPPRERHNQSPYVSPDLKNSSHVFLRTDAVRRSLQPPYTGSHPVLSRTPKTSIIRVNGREETVSNDRLKPAHVLNPESLLKPWQVSLHLRIPRPALHPRQSLGDYSSPPAGGLCSIIVIAAHRA